MYLGSRNKQYMFLYFIKSKFLLLFTMKLIN